MMSTLPLAPLPLNSEWMTFERNRNAGCEDCFNRIYCQKAKPRWKPAKMSAAAWQGCFAFLHLQRRTWLFVFALSFFFFFVLFFQEHHSLSEFVPGILRCLHLLCQRPGALKSLRSLAWNTLCTFLPVISPRSGCMCQSEFENESGSGTVMVSSSYNIDWTQRFVSRCVMISIMHGSSEYSVSDESNAAVCVYMHT